MVKVHIYMERLAVNSIIYSELRGFRWFCPRPRCFPRPWSVLRPRFVTHPRSLSCTFSRSAFPSVGSFDVRAFNFSLNITFYHILKIGLFLDWSVFQQMAIHDWLPFFLDIFHNLNFTFQIFIFRLQILRVCFALFEFFLQLVLLNNQILIFLIFFFQFFYLSFCSF